MSKGGYTLLGWIVWQVGRRVARRKLAENRAKLGATAVALVIVAGVLAARSGGGEE